LGKEKFTINQSMSKEKKRIKGREKKKRTNQLEPEGDTHWWREVENR
jgi:hypothetical protein